MAFGIENAGKVAVDAVNSQTLPHVAAIITDTLTQVAVITNGLLTGIEGERMLATQGLQDTLKPILDESKAWRELLAGGFSGKVGGIPFTIVSGVVPVSDQPKVKEN